MLVESGADAAFLEAGAMDHWGADPDACGGEWAGAGLEATVDASMADGSIVGMYGPYTGDAGYTGEGGWEGYYAEDGSWIGADGDMQMGYEYGASTSSTGPAGFSQYAMEFVPGGWTAPPQEGGSGCTAAVGVGGGAGAGVETAPKKPRPREGEVVTSLLDPEELDPGLGRASQVRASDAGGRGGRPEKGKSDKGPGKGAGKEEDAQSRTLWVGDVERGMNEDFIANLFCSQAAVTNVVLVRDGSEGGGGGGATGHALVEFVSAAGAAAVLASLGGRPMEAEGGARLRVEWPSASMADGGRGRKGGRDSARDDTNGRGRAPLLQKQLLQVQQAQQPPSQPPGAGGGAEGEGVGDGVRRRRVEGGGAEGGSNGRVAKGGGRGEESSWAYIDPRDEVQVGFTLEEMRQWYDLGYFKKDLKCAVVRGPANRAKAPPMREFYTLAQWFPDQSKCFTFVPKF